MNDGYCSMVGDERTCNWMSGRFVLYETHPLKKIKKARKKRKAADDDLCCETHPLGSQWMIISTLWEKGKELVSIFKGTSHMAQFS